MAFVGEEVFRKEDVKNLHRAFLAGFFFMSASTWASEANANRCPSVWSMIFRRRSNAASVPQSGAPAIAGKVEPEMAFANRGYLRSFDGALEQSRKEATPIVGFVGVRRGDGSLEWYFWDAWDKRTSHSIAAEVFHRQNLDGDLFTGGTVIVNFVNRDLPIGPVETLGLPRLGMNMPKVRPLNASELKSLLAEIRKSKGMVLEEDTRVLVDDSVLHPSLVTSDIENWTLGDLFKLQDPAN